MKRNLFFYSPDGAAGGNTAEADETENTATTPTAGENGKQTELLKDADPAAGGNGKDAAKKSDNANKPATTTQEPNAPDLDSILGMDDEALNSFLTENAENAKKAVKAATQRNMSLADERRQFEQEKTQHYSELDRRIAQINQMVQQLDRSQNLGMGANRKPVKAHDDEFSYEIGGSAEAGEGGGELSFLRNRVQQLEESLGLMNFDFQTQQVERELRTRYQDFDPRVVRDQINKLEQHQLPEIVYKAMKFDGMENEIAEAEMRGAKKMLEKLRDIQKTSKDKRVPIVPTAGSGGRETPAKAKSLSEATEQAMKRMHGGLLVR